MYLVDDQLRDIKSGLQHCTAIVDAPVHLMRSLRPGARHVLSRLRHREACALLAARREPAAALVTSLGVPLVVVGSTSLAPAMLTGEAPMVPSIVEEAWPPPQHRSGRKVLLHSCCAPCSGAMVEAMVDAGHAVTIFFYNPNIHPRAEYEIRKQENKRYAAALGIPFVDLDDGIVGGVDVDEWYKRAKGLEFCPERGARCSMCFDMRLERTALYAYEHGFDSFTTTNATSRWKDEAQVMRNPPTAMHDAVPPLIPPPCMTRHPSQCDAISSADLGGRR